MLLPIKLPPGMYQNGTELQAEGRYKTGNLMRFFEGTVRPWGGWQKHSSAAAMTGVPRAMITWRQNTNGTRWIAVATNSHLYVIKEDGTLVDITPSGFTAGAADATNPTGYGSGTYGSGLYGAPRIDTSVVTPAAVWTLDLWGDHLVACCEGDGKLYEWALDPAVIAAQIAGSPTGCAGLVVTPEGMLMALGAGGDRRTVANSDQYADTTWTVLDTNQARSYPLRTPGTLMRGVAMKGQTLLLTSVDAWVARYQGYPLVYGYQRVGQGCGLIAKGAVVATDSQAIWMGQSGFFAFDGASVSPIACEVYDGVFGNMNTIQSSKVTAIHLSQFGEVVWFYPSASSLENDSYVAFNYRENHWVTGQTTRTSGWDRGPFNSPMMTGADGFLYEHEVGWSYSGPMPYLESGPVLIGQGDRMMEIQHIVPDDVPSSSVSITILGKPYPLGDETSFGPYAMAARIDLLTQATQIRFRYDAQAIGDFRLGTFKIDAVLGDPYDTGPVSALFILDLSQLDGPNVLS